MGSGKKKIIWEGFGQKHTPIHHFVFGQRMCCDFASIPNPMGQKGSRTCKNTKLHQWGIAFSALTRADIWASGPPGVKAHWGQTNFYKHWCQPYLWSKKLSRYSSHWCPTHDCAAFEGVKNFQTFYLKLLDIKKQKVCISIWTLITCNYFTTLLNLELRLNR